MKCDETPLVFIVLVNYNGSKLTIECIKSLKNITYTNYKIIVVDNCSHDDSVEQLMKYESEIIKLICVDDNLGFTGGNNVGIKYALKNEADYILLLNNDTVVEKDFLEPLLKVFYNIPQCGLSIGKIFFEGERERIWYGGGTLNYHTASVKHIIDNHLSNASGNCPVEVLYATGCCFFLSRGAVELVGFLDDDYFAYYDDADYSYRVHKQGLKIIYVPQSVIYHKISSTFGETSMTTQRLMVRNAYLMIKKNYKWLNKIFSYGCSTILFLYRVYIGQMSFKYFINGTFDFLKNKRGKPDWLRDKTHEYKDF